MKDVLIGLVVIRQAEEKAQDTGKPGIFSKSPTKAYSDGWDSIWGKTEDKTTVAKKDLN